MAFSIEEIKKPIAAELETFEIKFKEAMRSNTPLLDRVMRYIVSRKGKQMRPMFVFLSAKLQGKTTDATYVAASLVEILHTATLVHDDVVDDSYQRRGFFSINALWKNKIAVLVGDYLLAKGLLLSVDNGQFQLLQILSNTIREMSEGELLQLEKARRLDIQEDIYFEIIRKKTASLIASACACGAASVSQDEAHIQNARLLGEKIGIAFQIKDDMLDYGGEDIGKPHGIDIKEKKMTLPLIYTLGQVDGKTRKNIINIVKNENTNPQKVAWIIEQIHQAGGMNYAKQKMTQYRDEALAVLAPYPDGEIKNAIINMIHYTIERKK